MSLELLKEKFSDKKSYSASAKGTKIGADGIAKNIHIMGPNKGTNVKSGRKKAYVYTESALKNATTALKYEGASVQISHTTDAEGNTFEDRQNDPTKKIAVLRNSTYKDGEGVFADVHFNTGHPFFPATKWWLENAPDQISMSHEAMCKYNDSTDQIVEVDRVLFVALVGAGNTTNGMYKDGAISDGIESDEQATRLFSIMNKFQSLCNAILYPYGKTLTQGEMAVQLTPIAQDLVKELKGFNVAKDASKISDEIKKDTQMEFDKLTLEELKAKRKDLVDLIAKDAIDSEAALTSKVDTALKDIPADKRGKMFVSMIRDSIRAGKDVTEFVAEQVSILKDSVEASKKEVAIPTSTGVSKTSKEEVAKDKVAPIKDEDLIKAFNG
jgi:hypothetical protein